jgi:hypothetical protein
MKLARQPMMVPEFSLLGPSTRWSARIDSCSVSRRPIREFHTRKIKERKRRLTLSEPESEDRSLANYFNGPIRIVVEDLFGSLVANDQMPPLTEELHIHV